MTVDIYDAEADDIPEICQMIEASLKKEHNPDQIKQLMVRLYSGEAFQKTIESDNRHLIIAIVEDAIAGVCQYGIPLMDDCDCEDLRSIQFLHVHPDANHDDIASALIYDVEESIDVDAGVQRLSVFVNPDNKSLVKFYAGLGFVHDQVEDLDGEWYMEKDL